MIQNNRYIYTKQTDKYEVGLHNWERIIIDLTSD